MKKKKHYIIAWRSSIGRVKGHKFSPWRIQQIGNTPYTSKKVADRIVGEAKREDKIMGCQCEYKIITLNLPR